MVRGKNFYSEFRKNQFWDPCCLTSTFLIYFFSQAIIDTASDADDATPYVHAKNISWTIESLEKALDILFKWFRNIV